MQYTLLRRIICCFRTAWEKEHGNLWEELCRKKLLIRDCSNYRGLGQGFYRICVKTQEDNELLLEYLKDIIKKEKKGDSYEFVSDYSCG